VVKLIGGVVLNCDTCWTLRPKKLHKIKIEGKIKTVCPLCYKELKQLKQLKEGKSA
jgi:hypothetical protein